MPVAQQVRTVLTTRIHRVREPVHAQDRVRHRQRLWRHRHFVADCAYAQYVVSRRWWLGRNPDQALRKRRTVCDRSVDNSHGERRRQFKLGYEAATFDGRMDEFGFWIGRCLSQSEATALYNGGAGLAYDTFCGPSATPVRLPRPHLSPTPTPTPIPTPTPTPSPDITPTPTPTPIPTATATATPPRQRQRPHLLLLLHQLQHLRLRQLQ